MQYEDTDVGLDLYRSIWKENSLGMCKSPHMLSQKHSEQNISMGFCFCFFKYFSSIKKNMKIRVVGKIQSSSLYLWLLEVILIIYLLIPKNTYSVAFFFFKHSQVQVQIVSLTLFFTVSFMFGAFEFGRSTCFQAACAIEATVHSLLSSGLPHLSTHSCFSLNTATGRQVLQHLPSKCLQERLKERLRQNCTENLK